jgi:hypothetical protein
LVLLDGWDAKVTVVRSNVGVMLYALALAGIVGQTEPADSETCRLSIRPTPVPVTSRGSGRFREIAVATFLMMGRPLAVLRPPDAAMVVTQPADP